MKLIELIDGHIYDCVAVAHQTPVDRGNIGKLMLIGRQIHYLKTLREEVAKRSAFRINWSLS